MTVRLSACVSLCADVGCIQSRPLVHPSLSSAAVSAVITAGRVEYRRRLLVRLSEPGATGTAYFPPELQQIIAEYVQGTSEPAVKE